MKAKKVIILFLVLTFFITACSETSLNPVEQNEAVEQEKSRSSSKRWYRKFGHHKCIKFESTPCK